MIHFANASEPSEDASSPWEGLGDTVPAAVGDSFAGMTTHLSAPNHLSTEPTTESGPLVGLGEHNGKISTSPKLSANHYSSLGLPYRCRAECVLFRDVYSSSSRDNLEGSQAVIYLGQKSMTCPWTPVTSRGHSNLNFRIFYFPACCVSR